MRPGLLPAFSSLGASHSVFSSCNTHAIYLNYIKLSKQLGPGSCSFIRKVCSAGVPLGLQLYKEDWVQARDLLCLGMTLKDKEMSSAGVALPLVLLQPVKDVFSKHNSDSCQSFCKGFWVSVAMGHHWNCPWISLVEQELVVLLFHSTSVKLQQLNWTGFTASLYVEAYGDKELFWLLCSFIQHA